MEKKSKMEKKRIGRPPQNEADRFWGKVIKTSKCWLWSGGPYDLDEYGRFYKGDGTGIPAHRYSYELVYGAIPKGTILHHICRNKRCVKPEHLQALTPQQNTIADKDMIALKSAWGRLRK